MPPVRLEVPGLRGPGYRLPGGSADPRGAVPTMNLTRRQARLLAIRYAEIPRRDRWAAKEPRARFNGISEGIVASGAVPGLDAPGLRALVARGLNSERLVPMDGPGWADRAEAAVLRAVLEAYAGKERNHG